MKKIMKARGLGHPCWLGRAIRPLAGTCNVDDWVRGQDKGASDGEVRRTSDACAQLDVVDDAGKREHQGLLEVLPEAHPLQGVGILIEEVIETLHT